MLGSIAFRRAAGALLRGANPAHSGLRFAPLALSTSVTPRQYRQFSSVEVMDVEPSALEEVEDGSQKTYHEILADNEHVDEFGRVYSTGRRKTSTARVWLKEGSGQFLINGKRVSEYFQVHPREHALAPLLATRTAGFLDVWCTVKGGGTLGQAGAVRLGISKALSLWDRSMRNDLKSENLLFRDPRNVERKKPGQKKARKKYQWVKR